MSNSFLLGSEVPNYALEEFASIDYFVTFHPRFQDDPMNFMRSAISEKDLKHGLNTWIFTAVDMANNPPELPDFSTAHQYAIVGARYCDKDCNYEDLMLAELDPYSDQTIQIYAATDLFLNDLGINPLDTMNYIKEVGITDPKDPRLMEYFKSRTTTPSIE
jgi:hypothetical protein